MKEEDAKRLKRKITATLILLPVLIASMVLGGVFFGFYLSDIFDARSRLVFPFVFATLGFALSIVASYFIAKWVAYSAK